ncbi:hypothetical protein, conserved [Plasmodium gonderi]|uniref:Protein archease-like n=1 Tax=Plasmodium gonderi TaxID=77519 RepID=A0A1Y1JNB5_PLAGO|nr:hypothetical protein, conserved [Plasmodium gonderi]GAW82945.1 hypothetical protein, conserved [Plasmodium gonderi]
MKEISINEIHSLPQRDRRKISRGNSSDDIESEDNCEKKERDHREVSGGSDEISGSSVNIESSENVDSNVNIESSDKTGSIENMGSSDKGNPQNVGLPYEKKIIQDDRLEKSYSYEYLDHPADVILHSYGKTLRECFESLCVSMFNYMCNLNDVELKISKQIIARGSSMEDLLYNFLTECHFLYGSEYFICKAIDILVFDNVTFYIEAHGFGDFFSLDIHESGTEIKAITKHELKICLNDDLCEAFVLVDI